MRIITFSITALGLILSVLLPGKARGEDSSTDSYNLIPEAKKIIDGCQKVIDVDIKSCIDGFAHAQSASTEILTTAQKNLTTKNVQVDTIDSLQAIRKAKNIFKIQNINCIGRVGTGLGVATPPSTTKNKCEAMCGDEKLKELENRISQAKTNNLQQSEQISKQGDAARGELEEAYTSCSIARNQVLDQFANVQKSTDDLNGFIKVTKNGFSTNGEAAATTQEAEAAGATTSTEDPSGKKSEDEKGLKDKVMGAFTPDNLKKVGLGAAVGAGAMHFLGGSEKEKDDDKDGNSNQQVSAEQKEKDFQNGYTYSPTGERINCQSIETYMTPDCKPVMLNFCGKSTNANNASCNAFAGSYCSAATGSQSFCLGNSARIYCTQTGPHISQNPACQWISSRPANCARQPESSACLLNWTVARLTEECPKYPYDPLCKAHEEGKEVLQTEGTLLAENNAAGGGLSSLINSTDQASKATTSVNLFGAGSAALSDLCVRGVLVNCRK